MPDYRRRLQDLLRELFQFDAADLDFGIYAVMNRKRDQIEGFIEHDLLDVIRDGLQLQSAAQRHQAETDFVAARQKLIDAAGDALDGDQVKPEYRQLPLYGLPAIKHAVDEYDAVKAVRDEATLSADLEAQTYNDLYRFFARYYDDGDFISQRRYGAENKYAIPYNGEEVTLYWANFDQYYVKTGEYFTDYRFAVEPAIGFERATVHFKLRTASVEQNNVKGEKRFFLLAAPEPVTWDAEGRVLTIGFEYRPLTESEKLRYGTRDQQDKLLAEAEPVILKALRSEGLDDRNPVSRRNRVSELLAERLAQRSGEPGKEKSLLARQLTRYAARNTRDYFIHKDLKAFLTRELDFFLKNEVLRLEDLDFDRLATVETAAARLKTIRLIAGRIIDFLAQIEDFQRRLWEKRKFVVQSDTCVTLDRVPPKLYAEIAANDRQREEWRKLYGLELGPDADLSQHPFAMVDTAFFDADFKARLLASFADLDAACDGLLVHGENFQALRLLTPRYAGQVKCVYIDPPYNSKTTEIAYKNTYKHSSWLALMANRLRLSAPLARTDGSHVIAIDENEQEVLGQLLSLEFPSHDKVCIAVVHNKKGIQGDYFSYNHEYAFFCVPHDLPETNSTPVPQDEWEFDNLRKWGRESERETARNCFYPIFVEDSKIVGFGDVCDQNYHPKASNIVTGGRIAVYPIDSQGVERKWRYARDSVVKIIPLLKVHVTGSGEVQIHKAKAERPIKTIWDDSRYIAGDYGTRWLTNLGLKVSENLYPKSVHTVQDAIAAVSSEGELVLDYFAGSGTTGHAVFILNGQGGGRRKCILVEMADHFDTVLKPRIQKVAYAADWRDGKPIAGSLGPVAHVPIHPHGKLRGQPE